MNNMLTLDEIITQEIRAERLPTKQKVWVAIKQYKSNRYDILKLHEELLGWGMNKEELYREYDINSKVNKVKIQKCTKIKLRYLLCRARDNFMCRLYKKESDDFESNGFTKTLWLY